MQISFGPRTQAIIGKLGGVERKALRFVHNKYKQSDLPTKLLKKAGILTLQNRAVLARSKLLCPLLQNKINIDISRCISRSETCPSQHKYTHSMKEYSCHTDCLENLFFSFAISDWNNLSDSTVSSCSIEVFCCAVENNLLAL